MQIYRIVKAQSNISIDLSKFLESLSERIESFSDYAIENQQRLSTFNFDLNTVINQLKSVNYPKTEEVRQAIASNDTSNIHASLMDIFNWYKENNSNHSLWSAISPVVHSINDYIEVLDGNKMIWTDEYKNQTIEKLKSETLANMQKISDNIQNAISRIKNWNGSHIVIKVPSMGEEFRAQDDAHIIVGSKENGMDAGFTYFNSDDKIEIDDVLEAGDEDFFQENNTQLDYFSLINELRNPSTNKLPKIFSLYTARPVKDRRLYENAKEIPSNIFLTNKFDFAEGFAREYGGNKDIWKIKILDTYLVKTMDSPEQKQYQAIGDVKVPVISTEMIQAWEE